MALTYQQLTLDVRNQFRRAGIEAAALEARELIGAAAGKSREALIRDGGQAVPPDLEARIRRLAARRLEGMPAAYLTGEWGFYGLALEVTPDVLIPRTDTEVLAEEAIRYVRRFGACRILDLCAGSGCIGLAVAAQVPGVQAVLAEVSERAREVCRRNIHRCGLAERVCEIQADVRANPSASLGKFQCIVSNPPYIPHSDIAGLDASVRDYEPHLALDGGPDGLDFYRVIAEKWRDVLICGGRIYFEVGIGQSEDVERILHEHQFTDIQTVRDTAGIPRVVSGEK